MMFFWYVYSVILCFDLCFCARLQSFVVFFKEFPASPYALLTTITNEYDQMISIVRSTLYILSHQDDTLPLSI